MTILNQLSENKNFNQEKEIIEPITYIPKKEIFQINQYDLNNNFIASYTNYSEAGRAVSSAKNSSIQISRVCRGQRKTAYGFIWKTEIIKE